MRVKIEVTKHDISRGKKGSPFNCPLARAVRRVCRKRVSVGVGTNFSFARKEDNADVKPLEKTRKFMRSFDQGDDVKPFSFTLNIPKNFLRKVS